MPKPAVPPKPKDNPAVLKRIKTWYQNWHTRFNKKPAWFKGVWICSVMGFFSGGVWAIVPLIGNAWIANHVQTPSTLQSPTINNETGAQIVSKRQTWEACYFLGKRLEITELEYSRRPRNKPRSPADVKAAMDLAFAQVQTAAKEAHVDPDGVMLALHAVYAPGQSVNDQSQLVEECLSSLGQDVSMNNAAMDAPRCQASYRLGRDMGELLTSDVMFGDKNAPLIETIHGVKGFNLGMVADFNISEVNSLLVQLGLSPRIKTTTPDSTFPDGSPAVFVLANGGEPAKNLSMDVGFRSRPGVHLPMLTMYKLPPKNLVMGGVLLDPSCVLLAPDGFLQNNGLLSGQMAVHEYASTLAMQIEQELGSMITTDPGLIGGNHQ